MQRGARRRAGGGKRGQIAPAVAGLDRFGESAPAGALFKHFGFTAQNVADTMHKVLSKSSSK